MAQLRRSGSKATRAAAERRSEACQREELPGRRARGCGRGRRRRRGARNSQDTAHLPVGGVSEWVGYMQIIAGTPANHGARRGAGLGPDAGRRAGSGRCRLELAERFCRRCLGLGLGSVRPRATNSGGSRRRCGAARGRSLRRRPPPAAPSQRTPCIRSLPRPRAAATPSFP